MAVYANVSMHIHPSRGGLIGCRGCRTATSQPGLQEILLVRVAIGPIAFDGTVHLNLGAALGHAAGAFSATIDRVVSSGGFLSLRCGSVMIILTDVFVTGRRFVSQRGPALLVPETLRARALSSADLAELGALAERSAAAWYNGDLGDSHDPDIKDFEVKPRRFKFL